jgi:predicted DNA repair protein MutK
VSIGLIALLDDIAGLAKVAAASLDDVAAQAAKAGSKAAGIVIDDAAVTPRYVVGFKAERELPIIGKIALGSLKNKLLFLMPAALILSFFAPWAITPLLMLGGAYLCYEGAEKIYEIVRPHDAHAHEAKVTGAPVDPQAIEDQKVSGAIKTDFILSAEIMAITLSTVTDSSFMLQAFVLTAVGIGITALVYGAVALIVKADDAGLALAAGERPVSGLSGSAGAPTGADRALRPITQGIGRALVVGMPVLLKILSVVGTAAMLWVGGGIIVHGLEEYGFTGLGHGIHGIAETVAHAVPVATGFLEWLVTAAASGLVGLVLGGLLIPVVHYVGAPVIRGMQRLVLR